MAGRLLELSASAKERDIVLKRKEDVFDSQDFDPIKFVNQVYPDETSLTDLDRFIGVLNRQIRTVDKEIFQAVRAQGGAHTRARQELEAAQQQVVELVDRVKGIQRKAEESETLVQEICRDIRKLDYAKRHLTNGITALRRLAMLTAAVADLEANAGRRDGYKKSANLLEAVHQLMEYFAQYEDVPKIKGLSKRLAVIEAQLQDSVLDDFKVLMGTADVKVSPENLDRLAGGCLVADALGPRVRDQLIDWMCEREMNIFQAHSQTLAMESGSHRLDKFDKRLQWFRERLEARKEEWGLFPDQWRVPQVLCLTFCKITKAYVKSLLSEEDASSSLGTKSAGGATAAASSAADIGPLVKAVVATNKFERDMAALFGGGTDENEDLMGDSDGASASEVVKRLERLRQKQKVEQARRQMDQLSAAARAERDAVRTSFEGAISEAFEPALRGYVAVEGKELNEYMEGLLREEVEHGWKPTEEEEGSLILQSANKLFLKIRGSLNRCVKMISKGPTLATLMQVFQRVLASYCRALDQRLPRTASGLTHVTPPYAGYDWYVRVSEDEEKVICHIMHTAEFCRETLEALAQAVTKDIKPALADKIDVSHEEGLFQSLASACMGVLVLGINTRLDAALQELGRVNWATVENPGDDSTYVNTIRKVLLETGPRLGVLLPDRTTLSFVCDKIARAFVPRFHDAVAKCRKVSDKGTLQLSIDCDAVRRVLHDFPRSTRRRRETDTEVARPAAAAHGDSAALQGGDDDDAGSDDGTRSGPFQNYHAYVEREMGAVINMVKVLQAKPENLVDTFLLLMPASAQTMDQFARVCDMKGVSSGLKQHLIGLYHQKVSGGQEGAGGAAGGGSGGGMMPSSSNNLGTFKINMPNITALASNINFPARLGGGGGGGNTPGSPAGAAKGLFSRSIGLGGGAGSSSSMGGFGGGGPGGQLLHQRGASISAAAENMATKTKDTFAKVGTFMGTGFAKMTTALGQQQHD